jgi:hypothetical protein
LYKAGLQTARCFLGQTVRKTYRTNPFFVIRTNDAFPAALPLKRTAYGELSEDGTNFAYTPSTWKQVTVTEVLILKGKNSDL